MIDAWDALGGGGSTLRELLAADRLEELANVEGVGLPLADAILAPPIPDPEKIIGIGLNYAKHAAEARAEPPPSPTFFAKFRNALRPDGATVSLPAASSKVDYEAEVAVVIGIPREGDLRGRGARPRRRLHAAQRPLGARPAVRNAPVDAGQGLRRLGPVRTGSGDSRRGRSSRRNRDRARPQWRADAGGHHRRPDLLDPRNRLPPLDA